MGILSGPWTWKRIKSFAALAWAFNRRQARRLLLGRRDDGGLPRFLENFAGEGMAPLTPADAEAVLDLSACVYCGLCEAVCPHPADRWPAYARALDLASVAAADLPAPAAACEPECRRCEAICPTRVPLRRIPAFVRRGGAASGAGGGTT